MGRSGFFFLPHLDLRTENLGSAAFAPLIGSDLANMFLAAILRLSPISRSQIVDDGLIDWISCRIGNTDTGQSTLFRLQIVQISNP